MEERDKIERVEGWRCKGCGEIYKTKEEALRCYESHKNFTVDFKYELGQEFPVEVWIMKHQGGYVTEIASYELKKIDKGLKIPSGEVHERIEIRDRTKRS